MTSLAPTVAAFGGTAYERSVLGVWCKIQASLFGYRLLRILFENGTKQVILITSVADPDKAGATVLARGSSFQNAYPVGYRLPGPVPAGTLYGTGLGSPSLLEFNPNAPAGGIDPDVTLLHELVHAYRQACGRWSPLPILRFVKPTTVTDSNTENNRFGNWEEWFAVVCEGIYAAEMGAHSVRTTHNNNLPYFAMEMSGQSQSRVFADKFGPAIVRIRNTEPLIYSVMRSSNAWFNPIREYEDLLMDFDTPGPFPKNFDVPN